MGGRSPTIRLNRAGQPRLTEIRFLFALLNLSEVQPYPQSVPERKLEMCLLAPSLFVQCSAAVFVVELRESLAKWPSLNIVKRPVQAFLSISPFGPEHTVGHLWERIKGLP